MLAKSLPKPTPRPTPMPAPKPTIINEPIMEWAEEIRTTRVPVNTDCHLVWGENQTLEHPEKLKEILIEIVKKTCKCEDKNGCECYKPAVILITTRSIELRNHVQKSKAKQSKISDTANDTSESDTDDAFEDSRDYHGI